MTEARASETARSEETRSTSPRASLVGGDEDGSDTGRDVAAGALVATGANALDNGLAL